MNIHQSGQLVIILRVAQPLRAGTVFCTAHSLIQLPGDIFYATTFTGVPAVSFQSLCLYLLFFDISRTHILYFRRGKERVISIRQEIIRGNRMIDKNDKYPYFNCLNILISPELIGYYDHS